ncbi:MAG: SDR family NAD(P)-dependent oxidoreductase [Thermoleophilaceae bacterium]
MEIAGARILVAGATGALGARLARALAAEGARVALAGRNPERLSAVAEELGAPSVRFEAREAASCERAVEEGATALGGLDGLVVGVGVTAFGPAETTSAEAASELFAVNALGPMALVRAALGRLGDGGAVVALSAIVADHPTADMAAYSASKAALSAFLAAVRRERRRSGLTVLDVRPQHLATGFSDRAIEGEAPSLPDPADPDVVVATVLDALRADKREVAWDLGGRELLVR